MVTRRVALLGALLCLTTVALAGCGGDSGLTFSQLPPGDPANGEALFTRQVNGTPACNSCHTVDGSPLSGPTLQGLGARAGNQVAGLGSGDYVLQSITQPAAHLVPGFSNLMYGQYGERLTGQQLADVIAYVLAQ